MSRATIVILSVLWAAVAQAQTPTLVTSTPVESPDASAAVRAVRAAFPACRGPAASVELPIKLERGGEATDRPDVVTLVTAECRRGRTQFLHVALDRPEEPEEIGLRMIPQAGYDGLVAEPETRRIFGRLAARAGALEEIPWQAWVRDYLINNRLPLREYAAVLLPPVPTGALPSLPPPPDPAVALRARLVEEMTPQLEATIRERLRVEVRQEMLTEVQARLDRAREIAEGLQREAREAQAALAAAERRLADATAEIGRERSARETAERLMGLVQRATNAEEARQAAERDREGLRQRLETETRAAREAADRAIAQARETAERALALTQAREAAERALASTRDTAERAVAAARDETRRLLSEARAEAERLLAAERAARQRAEDELAARPRAETRPPQ